MEEDKVWIFWICIEVMRIISVLSAFNCSLLWCIRARPSEMQTLEEENYYLVKLTEVGWGTKLIVIREAAMKGRMVTDNSRERLSVQSEDNWPKHWPLRNTNLEGSWKGLELLTKLFGCGRRGTSRTRREQIRKDQKKCWDVSKEWNDQWSQKRQTDREETCAKVCFRLEHPLHPNLRHCSVLSSLKTNFIIFLFSHYFSPS